RSRIRKLQNLSVLELFLFIIINMSYYTYILFSEKLGSFYKGSTSDIVDRINRHNAERVYRK
ncbi:MAG: hypothetical protein DRI86_05185, partial [Bacteroidetes bacterium]